MKPIIIRRGTLDDIPKIMQLIAEVVPAMIAAGNLQWDDKYPNPDVFKQDVLSEQIWIAVAEGEVAGVAAHTTAPEPDYAAAGIDTNRPAIVTHRLAVSPRYQGMGIAAALLNKAAEVALSKGITLLLIDTNINNLATQKLFPKLGYRLAGEISLALKPGLKFYCYEKHL